MGREASFDKPHQGLNGHAVSNESNAADEAFIRAAIEKSNLNALRLTLLQLSGDPELAKIRLRRNAIRGGALFSFVPIDEDVPLLKEKALAYLLKQKPGDATPPPPSKAETRKLMNMYGNEPLSEAQFEFYYEELALEEFPRKAEWKKKPSAEKIKSFNIIVIGGGISGIATAIQFKQLGLNFKVLERHSGVGGTWLINSYPDARVDVTSYLFQYKFVKNYPWKGYFATAPETLEYLQYVAKTYEVEGYFHFNREVNSAVWHEDTNEWELTVKHADGRSEIMRCNAIVSGTGLFSTPSVPHINGIRNYTGHIFHTTRWNHDFDYRNKRVAVLGTGSTGVQVAPKVASEAKSLTVYQRTPTWIMSMEGYKTPIDDHVKYLFDYLPYYWNWVCYASHVTSQQLQFLQTYDKDWIAKGGLVNERNDIVRKTLTDYIRSKADGIPGLLEKIMPNFSPMVRRLVVDNGFYDMLRRDNVELVTEKIDSFTETGIKTFDGVEREFDLVVLGTGFKVQEYFYPCHYVGRNRTTLENLWEKDGPRSYLGFTMPGLPNLWALYGPNHQPRAGGHFSWAEIWSRYIATCIIHLIENDMRSMDVRQEVFDEYQVRLDTEAKNLIWEDEGHAYFVNKHGRQSINMPWTCHDYHCMVQSPNFDDFHIR